MSLFPRFSQEFSPLFRLLDDYDRASRDGLTHSGRHIRAFAPKFDVKEHNEYYELHGDLPGIDQKDVSIEWSDSNTLTVSGRTESRYESGEPAAPSTTEGITGTHDYKKPTVEEVDSSNQPADNVDTTDTTVAKTNANKEVAKSEDAPKYWVTERSVGEFHRTFSFPGHVDQDSVKASLKNGVLTITVPKAKKPQTRRINIE